LSITQQLPKNKHTIEKQNEMKKLAKIPSQLLTKESTTKLALKEQPYILLIPKSIIQNQGLMKNQFSFDLLVNSSNKLVLIESQEHTK